VLFTVKLIVTDFYTVYYILYGLAALLGKTVSFFFFAFQIVEITQKYPVLMKIIMSFWLPIDIIILTYISFMVVNYGFTLLAYTFIYEDYAGFCDTTFVCFVANLDRAFKFDGGIGGGLSPPPLPTDQSAQLKFYGRLLYDNSYNIILMIVMISIISGIIIDKFCDMREEQIEQEKDIKNVCFICHNNRDMIDKASGEQEGFDNHIKFDHNHWNYLWFIAYLNQKNQNDFGGTESYVWDKIEDQDISWFPLDKAIVLKDMKDETEDSTLLSQLERLDNEGMELVKYTKKLRSDMEEIEFKLRKTKK